MWPAAEPDPAELDATLRTAVPQVLAALTRRYGDFDRCEDAAQDALLEASVQWRRRGIPEQPAGWLITAANRRLLDIRRSDNARRRRELNDQLRTPTDQWTDLDPGRQCDDTLQLLIMCCHSALTPAAQIGLTLRAVGGLTTAEVASALLITETTAAQRISRAKKLIKESGGRLQLPEPAAYQDRLRVVLQVLYLIFNEGHTASTGDQLQRLDLAAEAIRITRMVQRAEPDNGEVAGLLALMILTHARRDTRTAPDGDLIPAERQDRTRWHVGEIAEGTALIQATLQHGPLGPYQLQAAIAAVHAEADSVQSTDWQQILQLYRLLATYDPSPMVTLGMAVAVAMVDGPQQAIAMVEPLSADRQLGDHHRRLSVLGHLYRLADDHERAVEHFRAALTRTQNAAEQGYLREQIDRLTAE
ncbi:RNA polymerase sigma factor [Microlunatus elymi]|uniref:RNA polymerase sigma factor n=1 Tax=Microlunatus elymi TaxID=2596828 RepID=A0A516Q299_9ACTN|nr:DUF6596 domain-containing protein [Microlunatus elymi]QDP97546.1 RNA polymerase sigma factor [Microlunatus elymi]